MSADKLLMKLKRQLGTKLNDACLEALAERLSSQENVVKTARHFESSPELLSDWYIHGQKIIDTIGTGGARCLGELLQGKTEVVARAIIYSTPEVFAHTQEGFAEHILNRSRELPEPLLVALLETVPRMSTTRQISIATFNGWFDNRIYTDDTEKYLRLTKNHEVLNYFSSGGKVKDILAVAIEYDDPAEVMRAIREAERRNAAGFIDYIRREGKERARWFYSGDLTALKEAIPLRTVLRCGYRDHETMKILRMTPDEIIKLRERRKRPLSEDYAANNYAIAINAIDRWMELETELAEIKEQWNPNQYTEQIRKANFALGRVKQLGAVANSPTIKQSVMNSFADAINEHLDRTEIFEEVKAYEGVDVDREYFAELASRVNDVLEKRKITLQTENHEAARKFRQKVEELSYRRDNWRNLFEDTARIFGNHHPFYYSKRGQIFVNVPRKDLNCFATEKTEIRAGHLYFTKPTWVKNDS